MRFETAGTVPASEISSFVFSKINGGGGGSRTRVRNRSAWAVYVRSHLGCSRRPPPKVAKKRPASPDVFASGPRAGPSAIPLCDAHPVPRGRKGPVDGLLKQPALTVSWRLCLVPPVLRGVGLGTLSQPQQSRRNRFAPTFTGCVLGRPKNIASPLARDQGSAAAGGQRPGG